VDLCRVRRFGSTVNQISDSQTPGSELRFGPLGLGPQLSGRPGVASETRAVGWTAIIDQPVHSKT
jgi:hypothetical protein